MNHKVQVLVRLSDLPGKKRKSGKYEAYWMQAEKVGQGEAVKVGHETLEEALSLYGAARSQQRGRRPWLRSQLRDKDVYLWRESGLVAVSTAVQPRVRVPKPDSAEVASKAEPTVLEKLQARVAEKQVETVEREVCRKPMGANVADMCPLETGHVGPHQHGRGFQK